MKLILFKRLKLGGLWHSGRKDEKVVDVYYVKRLDNQRFVGRYYIYNTVRNTTWIATCHGKSNLYTYEHDAKKWLFKQAEEIYERDKKQRKIYVPFSIQKY